MLGGFSAQTHLVERIGQVVMGPAVIGVECQGLGKRWRPGRGRSVRPTPFLRLFQASDNEGSISSAWR